VGLPRARVTSCGWAVKSVTAHRQTAVIQGGAWRALQQALWERSLAAVSGGIGPGSCIKGQGADAPAAKTAQLE